MAQDERFHGGLVFFDNKVCGLDAFCRAAASTLEDYGYLVDRQSILPGGQARILSSRVAIRLQLNDTAPRARLVLTLQTAGRTVVDPDQAQLLLLVMLYRILDMQPAQSVEWLDPGTVLPAGRFLGAVTRVSPRRVRGRQEVVEADDIRFSPVDEAAETISCRYDEMNGPGNDGPVDEDALAQAFRAARGWNDADLIEHDAAAESDIRRLAAWGMTGVVAFLSGPVGLSMAAVNLMRGEDFRLNTHVLALTGFLGFATSTGTFNQFVAALPV